MKKRSVFIIALLIGAIGFAATEQASAQQRTGNVVKVQGHVHELLTKNAKAAGALGKSLPTPFASGNINNINLGDIQCWAGSVDPTLPVDSAVLLIKWTDGKAAVHLDGDSILAFGYRWNPISIYDDPTYGPDTVPVTKYTIDMIRAVANSDCRFSALLQNTSGGSFAVGGFGYNFEERADERVSLRFDEASAKADTLIKFHYQDTPNCLVGQGAIPYNVTEQVTEAIRRSTGGTGTGTGVIRHPFDADYGYPAYDFDYWKLTNPDDDDQEWQAGWYKGYWSFYTKEGLSGTFNYAPNGIAQQVLNQHSVSAFVFETNMNYPAPYNMTGNYTSEPCNCGCSASATKVNANAKGSRK